MKKLLAIVAVAGLLAPAFADDAGLSLGGRSAKQAPDASAPARVGLAAKGGDAAAKPKEWTVMVFINGKNDLEMAGLYNVNEMEKVGSGKDINIVVEQGRMNGQGGDTHLDGDWTGSRRMLIKKDNNPNKITSTVLQEDKKVDMGDYKRAVDFVQWSKKRFPAKRYMLIIWNHGSGWLDPRKDNKGISFDDETGNYIRTAQIGKVLQEAGKVDILAFDACLMQMAEVAYEVKDQAQVIVGSEETVPGQGYPYALFLGAMTKKPGMSTEETGALMVEAYKMFYEKSGKNVQLSALRTSKLAGFGAKMGEFAAAAAASGDLDALKAARNGVIRYDALGAASDPGMTISFYGDVWQFAGLAAANVKDGPKAADLKAKAASLQEYIDKDLVIYNKGLGKNRAGHEMSESHGISVYLPPAETRIAQARLEGIFEAPYTDFAFDKTAKWHDFVNVLYGAK